MSLSQGQAADGVIIRFKTDHAACYGMADKWGEVVLVGLRI